MPAWVTQVVEMVNLQVYRDLSPFIALSVGVGDPRGCGSTNSKYHIHQAS